MVNLLTLQNQNLELTQLVTRLSARVNTLEQQQNFMQRKIDDAASDRKQAQPIAYGAVRGNDDDLCHQLPRVCHNSARNSSRESSVDSIRRCLATSNIPGAIHHAQQIARIDRGRPSSVSNVAHDVLQSLHSAFTDRSTQDADNSLATCQLPPFSPAPTNF